MAEKTKKTTKKASVVKEPATAYLTKRALVRAVNKGTKGLAEKEMELLGYVTRIEDGWVVRIDASGEKIRISKVDDGPSPKQIIVD